MDVGDLNGETSFAVICSFFNKFGALLGLKPLPFTKIELLLTKFDGAGRVDKELIDLHVKLLRGVQLKSANHTRWEQSLLKFCSLIQSLEAECLQLERFGYVHSPLSTKLAILKALCECQFDFNPKFKENILGSLGSSELRLLPVGYDKNGLAYWYQQDADLNLRIYTEEPDDLSGGTWELKAKSRDELATLLEGLKDDGSVPTVKEEVAETTEDGKENSGAKMKQEASSSAKTTPESKKAEEIIREKTPEEEPEEPEKPVKEEKPMKTKNKKGTFLDTFQDEKKTPKKSTPKGKKGARTETVKEEEKNEDKSDDSQMDIPDELKPFIDRRIMPRRSARSAALSQLKEEEEPKEKGKKKTDEQQKKPEPVESEKSDEDDDDSEGRTSDSDFMPLSELRKVASGRKRRFKKPKLSLSDAELESDSDGEETVKKERKKATEETLCKKCNKSNNWEVLLLCDKCDEAWHTWCLRPQLWYVPDEDWFCPKCQHAMLIDKFTAALAALDEALKKKTVEDKKKQTAADRLKREMEFIGVSMNNIIPTQENANERESSEDEEEEGEDETRARKKKAKKPIVPIAVGRSRRRVEKVDYNFEAFDELIQEAVDEIAEAPSKPKYRDPVRPQGGAGRGKDMANIIEAQRKKSDASGEASPGGAGVGKPPAKPAKSHRKLTDLDMDDVTESDTDEYQASENSPSEQSDDEYVPSDDEDDEPKRRSTRLRAQRRKSDEEFVVSGSDSDYKPTNSKKVRASRTSRTTSKRRKNDSTDESDDSLVAKSKAKRSKWGPKASSTDSDQSSDNSYSNRRSKKSAKKRVSEAGRPLRRARKSINYSALDGNSSSDDDGDSDRDKKKDARPVGALTRPRRAKISSDEAEFEPDEEESNSEGERKESEDDATASSSKAETKDSPAKSGARRKIESSSEESGDDDDDDDDQSPEEEAQDDPLPTMVPKRNSVDDTAATNGRLELVAAPNIAALHGKDSSSSQPPMPNGNQMSAAPVVAKVSVVVSAPSATPTQSVVVQSTPIAASFPTLPQVSGVVPTATAQTKQPPHPASVSVIQPLARMAVAPPQAPMQNPYATMGALPYPYYHPGYGPPPGHPGQMATAVQYAGLQPMAPYGMQQTSAPPMGWPPQGIIMGRPLPPEMVGQDNGGGSGSLSDVLANAMQGEYQ